VRITKLLLAISIYFVMVATLLSRWVLAESRTTRTTLCGPLLLSALSRHNKINSRYAFFHAATQFHWSTQSTRPVKPHCDLCLRSSHSVAAPFVKRQNENVVSRTGRRRRILYLLYSTVNITVIVADFSFF